MLHDITMKVLRMRIVSLYLRQTNANRCLYLRQMRLLEAV